MWRQVEISADDPALKHPRFDGLVDIWEFDDRITVARYRKRTLWGEVLWLQLRWSDNDPARQFSFYDKQRVKDDLAGPDVSAIEIYPAAADLRDTGNCAHLWVPPIAHQPPFGLQDVTEYYDPESQTTSPGRDEPPPESRSPRGPEAATRERRRSESDGYRSRDSRPSLSEETPLGVALALSRS